MSAMFGVISAIPYFWNPLNPDAIIRMEMSNFETAVLLMLLSKTSGYFSTVPGMTLHCFSHGLLGKEK